MAMQVEVPASLPHFSGNAMLTHPPMTYGSECPSLGRLQGLGVHIFGPHTPGGLRRHKSKARFQGSLGGKQAHLGHLKEVRVNGLLHCSHPGLFAEVVRPQQAEIIVRVAVVEG